MFHFGGAYLCMSPSLNQCRYLAVLNVTVLNSILSLIRVPFVLPVLVDCRLHVLWAVRKALERQRQILKSERCRQISGHRSSCGSSLQDSMDKRDGEKGYGITSAY